MAKKQEYVAVIVKEGIVEAIYKEYFDKRPGYREQWEKQMFRENRGCSIEEMSGLKVDKEIERYGKWLEKENKRKAKETTQLIAKSNKTNSKIELEPDEIKSKINVVKEVAKEAKKETTKNKRKAIRKVIRKR